MRHLIIYVFLLFSVVNIYSQNKLMRIDSISINQIDSKIINNLSEQLINEFDDCSDDKDIFSVYYRCSKNIDSISVFIDNNKVMDTIIKMSSIHKKIIEFKKNETDCILKIVSHTDNIFFTIKIDSTYRSAIVTQNINYDNNGQRKTPNPLTVNVDVVKFNNYIDVVYLIIDYYCYLELKYKKYGW